MGAKAQMPPQRDWTVRLYPTRSLTWIKETAFKPKVISAKTCRGLGSGLAELSAYGELRQLSLHSHHLRCCEREPVRGTGDIAIPWLQLARSNLVARHTAFQ